jgi:phosphoethanolamine N-methyltransferase
MMLDSHTKTLTKLELPEILAKAPYMDNKELAAGISRYTSVIAKRAKPVTAVEFSEDFIKVNDDTNSHLRSIKFLCKDVVNLEAEPNSFDVIFSNWIFMYMEDEEVKEFAQKDIKWLRPGGKLFLRESCFKQSEMSSATPIPRITVIRDFMSVPLAV